MAYTLARHGTSMARAVLANPRAGLGRGQPSKGPMATGQEFGADDIKSAAALGKGGLFS